MPSTAGISSARARMAEWLVLPPISVTMALMFSRLSPTVIEGVRSLAASTVPLGTADTSTLSIPKSRRSMRVRMSPMSVARCFISSSSTLENISIYIWQTLSTAASAQLPELMASSICPIMKGSCSIITWPVRISDSFCPTRSRISSAIFWVISQKVSAACFRRSFSLSFP